jgi:FixJ family two-component response regulator
MIASTTVAAALQVTSQARSRGVVFVVDDDAAARESVDLLVQCAGWSVETFSTAEEFLVHGDVDVDAPSCLIVDVQLPGLSGLDLQRRMAASDRETPTIFVTGRGDIATTVKAMKAGAVEFLTKPFVDRALLDAVEEAMERSRSARVRDAALRTLRARYDALTPREREVMALVVSGLLNKQVGGELGISEITVKAHRGQVMRKMRAGSLPDLVMMAATLRETHVAAARTRTTPVC